MELNDKKELTLKQKVLLYHYKSQQDFYSKWFYIKEKIKKFVDSFFLYFISFGVFLFLLHKVLTGLNLTEDSLTEDRLYDFAFATAGIIGASIAIIFSFSTFILQSTADLFSTGYLKKFIKDPKEVFFFWLLVFLTIASFFTPILLKKYALEVLAAFLLHFI